MSITSSTSEDEQKLLDWLRRADDAAPATQAARNINNNIYSNVACTRCASTKLCIAQDRVVCENCAAVNGDTICFTGDDGTLKKRGTKRVCDDNYNNRGATKQDKQRSASKQCYQRQYHWNEKIAARQNLEPRIPRDDLHRIERVVCWLCNVDTREQLNIDDLTPELLQAVCKALDDKNINNDVNTARWMGMYAERWLQIRYYLVTGCYERRAQEPPDSRWDIKWLSGSECLKARRLFRHLSQAFDELYYKPSSRFTRKNNYMPTSSHSNARHNMLQLDYIGRYIILAITDEKRYYELSTDFCFPLNRSDKALKKLNDMLEEMVNLLEKKSKLGVTVF